MSRTRALTALSILFAVASLTINFGIADLLDGVSSFIDQERNPVLDVGWGAIFGIMLPIGLLAQVRHAERRIAGLQQTALIAISLAVAGLAGKAWGYLALAAGIGAIFALLLWLHPARGSILDRGERIDPVLALLGAAALVPVLLYAARTTSNQRRRLGPDDAVSNGLHHWPVLAAFALSVVLVVLLAALRTEGWRIAAWSAALGAFVWGFSCFRYPDAVGGEGRAWAVAAMAWSIAVAAAATRRAVRTRAATAPA